MSEKRLLSERLKSDTRCAHESVDNLVMSVNPFADQERYVKFLQLQAAFHRAVDQVYRDEVLNQKIPHLASLARYESVVADLHDLGASEKVLVAKMEVPAGDEAIGWLYCAEGSNLGAAFLFKEVKKIHLDENKGARHLAPHESGRGKHWRAFVQYLNDLGLDEAGEQAAVEGAKQAFSAYKVALREVFGLPDGVEAHSV